MSVKHYTIGMAGHIDHGKTSLTKALTNVETDRLKEEKQRNISIELGYAPLQLNEGLGASIIDVPGHERFIRQMIAGVAGIDLVILVIAADEGIMPQTKEHIDILSFLGIKNSIVALSKVDKVDEEFLELVTEDIKDQLVGTSFKDAEIVYVDSLSKVGIEQLKETIAKKLVHIEQRNIAGAFRLPIDQVFTIQGQGTVVRGTVYEGVVREGSQLMILPKGVKVKVRQLQVHHQEVKEAWAGQRAAINISGMSKSEVERGDVLVSSQHFQVSDTIDVCIRTVDQLKVPLKQRGPIKLHLGTAEVMGKIVFFDRNELEADEEEIVCQLRLDEPIVTKRGDRFIVRRPTPTETIAGGWVIDPAGEKYKFGKGTIDQLTRKKEGTPKERVIDALRNLKLMSLKQLAKETSITEEEIKSIMIEDTQQFLEIGKDTYALTDHVLAIEEQLTSTLHVYHEKLPLRLGQNKAELVRILEDEWPKVLIEYTLTAMMTKEVIGKTEQYIFLKSFVPAFPVQWKTRIEKAIGHVSQDGFNVKAWEEYMKLVGVPEDIGQELKHFLIVTHKMYPLDDKMLIDRHVFEAAIDQLKTNTPHGFTLKEAKDILGLSRKYLIPFLEKLDEYKETVRDGDIRKWVK